MVNKIIQKIKDGATISFINLDKTPINYILGGIKNYNPNKIYYFPVYLESGNDIHLAIMFNLIELDKYSIQFKDQYGRDLTITSLEDYEKEEKKFFSEWIDYLKNNKEIEKQIFEQIKVLESENE